MQARKLEHSEWRRRVLELVHAVLEHEGGRVPPELRVEASRLMPWEYDGFIRALTMRPNVCVDCGVLFIAIADPNCTDCRKKQERDQLRRELLAEIQGQHP